jgi:CHAD domain-containing protein
MPYRLRQNENVKDGLRRCAREQLDAAIDQLTEGVKDDRVTAVHEARKAIKKSRSLLRLARGTITPDERRRVNAALRHAGRELSPARDAEVMVQAVDGLATRFAGQLPRSTFDAIRQDLEAERPIGSPADRVASELRAVGRGIDDWPMRRGGWHAVKPGLLTGYASGRDLLATAREQPTVENLHEWRKRVKDLWYHLRLLKSLSPGIIGGQADEADKLADLLGDDHDLAVLREAIDVDEVIGLIDHRRAQLQAQAIRIGERLYAEPPKAFARRMHRYWKVSRSRRRAAALA